MVSIREARSHSLCCCSQFIRGRPSARPRLPDCRFLDGMCLAPRAWRTMAPLRCIAKFDPFLSLDCAWVEGEGAQSNFAIWQPCQWDCDSSRPTALQFYPLSFFLSFFLYCDCEGYKLKGHQMKGTPLRGGRKGFLKHIQTLSIFNKLQKLTTCI